MYDLGQCTIVRETQRAVLVDTGTRQIWVPKKLVNVVNDPQWAGVVVSVPFWFARQRGLVVPTQRGF